MRYSLFLFLAVLSCARRERAVPQDGVLIPSAPAGPSAPPAEEVATRQPGEAVLLGNAQRLAAKTCKSPDNEAWTDVHFRAGLVRLEGNTRYLRELLGKPVLLLGEVAKRGSPEIPAETGNCAPVQRRSDWLDAPDGMILRREATSGIASFRVRAAQVVSPLTARQDGDVMTVELENPLAVAIDAAAVSVHYEGCFGKPMPHIERRKLGKLAPNARLRATVPTLAVDSRPTHSESRYHPVSVQVHGTAPDVYIDLDVRLSALGVELPCPKR